MKFPKLVTYGITMLMKHLEEEAVELIFLFSCRMIFFPADVGFVENTMT